MTRQRTIRAGALVAVVLAVLAATAPPVASTDAAELVQTTEELVVGSQHDSFGTSTGDADPQTLTNLTVVGSGASASVELADAEQIVESFEDNDISEYGGRTGAFSTQTGTVYDGSHALQASVNGSFETIASTSGLNKYPSAGDVIHTRVYLTDTGSNARVYFGAQSETHNPNGYFAELNGEENALKFGVDGTPSTSTSAPLNSYLNEWVDVKIDWGAGGTITITLYSASGTQLAQLTATDSTYTSGGIGWGQFNAGSATSYFDYMVTGGGTPSSATYVSAIHDISGGEEAAINIEQASNVSVDAEVRTDGGTTLAADTFTSASNHTLNLSETSSSQLETVLDIEVTGEDPQFSLADESILFNPHAPQASNLSPADGVELADPSVNFTVDVADADFPTAQGDSVEASLVVDNETVGTQTVTSNQTVTITKELTEGGEHTYHWELSDSYGEVTSTSTRTLSVPSKVTVRSVVGNHSIIDNQSLNISARLYSGELIFQRNVSNGRIDLSNVPVDREYILSVRSDGYYQRTIIISSVYEQSSIYLLPTDTAAVLDIFRLNDRTGKYPTESSKLVIKRALNTTDGGLEWVRVAGDYFGAAGQFKIQLQQDRRYRLVISNSQGDTRVLGHYSTDIAETVILNPVPIGVSLNVNASTYTWDAVRQNDTISFNYHDPKNETTQLHVSIYEQGNASNVVLNQTYLNDPYGTLSVTQPLTGNQTNASWVVEWSAERNGEKISGKVMTSSPREPLVPELADWIKHSLSITAVIIIGGLFTQLNSAVGGVTTAIVGGGFWFAGWLPNAAGGAIAIALLLSVLVKGAQARGL